MASDLNGLRVLMTTDTVGGVWTYALDLAHALAGFGVATALATMGGPLSAEQWRQSRTVPGLTIHESGYRLEWMEAPWADVEAAGRWLDRLELALKPDIVHLNHYAHGDLDWRAPALVVGHSCVVSWWHAVHGKPPPADFNRYRRVVRRGLAGAAAVVAPSRAMAEALGRFHGPLDDVRVIYNGRYPAGFRAGHKRAVVFCAGRLWDEAKNVRAVASAAPALPWPVHLAGETRHPDGGELRLRNVRIRGQLTAHAMRDELAAAAVYALPARYEPFGLSVLEAALSGCALLLGDIPSLRELWEGSALFVDPQDANAVQKGLWRLTSDSALRSRLKTAARKRARRYSLEASAASYANLYAEMLTGAAWRPPAGSRLQPRIG